MHAENLMGILTPPTFSFSLTRLLILGCVFYEKFPFHQFLMKNN